MKKSSWLVLLLGIVLAACLVAGCSRDPNVLKQKYFESGNTFLQKRQYREAAIQFRNAIKIDPRYAEAHYQLAQCLLNLGSWPEAYQELLRTVDVQPDNLNAQIDLARILVGANQPAPARDRIDMILAKDPLNVDARILSAKSYALTGNLTAALKDAEAAVQSGSTRADTYTTLAAVQDALGQPAPAEDSFKRALALDPKSLQTRMALAKFYQQRRRWSDAEAQLQQIITLDPKNVVPRIALCDLLLAQKQNSRAEQAARDAKDALKDVPEGYRLLGDVYFQENELSKASEEYSSLLRIHPKDLRVKKNFIQLLILQGNLVEADKLNAEILKGNSSDLEGQIALGQILVRKGRPVDAITPLESALKADPENAVAHYNLGLAFSASGDPSRAEAHFREAVRINPGRSDAQKALGSIAVVKGDLQTLTSAAAAVIAAEPNSPDGYLLRALSRSTRHDLGGAEADLKKAIELAPQSPVPYTRMAQFRAAQKDFAGSEKLFGQALDRDPGFTEALQGLTALLVSQNQSAAALARVNEQISKVPGNSTYYMLLAKLLFDKKEFENAEAALLKAANLNKSDPTPLLMLAEVQRAEGNSERSIATYQNSIQQNPNDFRSYYLLGISEEMRGDWQKAQGYYQKALVIQPDFPLAANNLAYLMLEHGGNTDVALSLAQTARQRLPDLPGVADTLAWAYYQKGAYKLAIDLLEEATKKAPQKASFQYHLGLAYQKTGDNPRAKVHLERALQLNPKFEHAVEIRNALSELGKG